MAYNAPSTQSTGTLITASRWNTDIVDNWAAIWVGTTAGDLDYYSSATAKTRVAIGSSGYGLFSTGSAPAWAPGMKVILNDTSDTVKQSSDAGNEVYTFTVPANTLGTNGMLGLCGCMTITGSGATTDNFAPLVWATFGSSNTSDGTRIGTSDELIVSGGSADSAYCWFDARIIAKGASAERLYGVSITSKQSGGNLSFVNSESVAIDQTADQEIRLLHTGVSTSDSCSFTLHDLMIYTVPYLTTT